MNNGTKTSLCNCEEYPHVLMLSPSAHTVKLQGIDLGELVIGPLEPGQEKKAELDGHWYLVKRPMLPK